MPSQDNSFLEAALTGYLQKRTELDHAIHEIQAELRAWGKSSRASAPVAKRKVRSAAARKRMAAAQKKRWEAYRKQKDS
jgi:hypothetical protein